MADKNEVQRITFNSVDDLFASIDAKIEARKVVQAKIQLVRENLAKRQADRAAKAASQAE